MAAMSNERAATLTESRDAGAKPVAGDLSWHTSHVDAGERIRFFKQEPATIWLTGLSGSGKTSLAYALELRLIRLRHACCVLDGDNVRHGLNRDLGFSPEDRKENIRRIAEAAKLMNDAGLFVITAFISPYRDDREAALQVIGGQRFVETWLSASIEVCEKRDTKGLYAKARAGELPQFTGVTAPYEPPEKPQLTIDSGTLALEASVELVIRHIAPRFRD